MKRNTDFTERLFSAKNKGESIKNFQITDLCTKLEGRLMESAAGLDNVLPILGEMLHKLKSLKRIFLKCSADRKRLTQRTDIFFLAVSVNLLMHYKPSHPEFNKFMYFYVISKVFNHLYQKSIF